ncbi:MAG: KAP family NTPase [Lautropia mirabilis]|nr:KAP family NTPase [Lautropia mirabilis]
MSTKHQAIETESNQRPIGSDHPLTVENAIQGDMLDRKVFAKNVADIICRSDLERTFSVSIEGEWGSGKTSILAMISSYIKDQDEKSIIINFNPWLIGDRDSLLRSFLNKLAKGIGKVNHVEDAKNAAKELKAYANVFDVIKWVPGAEPWASIIKGVLSSTGKAVGAVAEHKSMDIESKKEDVESSLRTLNKRIVVIIDDVDRLFPEEVYEMIRIIKAVGDLPSITYVIAWDRSYVEEALDKSSVPMSRSYLDKIVQMRLPVPALSLSSKERLLERSIERSMDPAAFYEYFDKGRQRLDHIMPLLIYNLMEQPRDVVRLFDLVAAVEPSLRREVVLSDIIGLSMLMMKGGAVFDLIKKKPSAFVGRLSIEDERNDMAKYYPNNKIDIEEIDHACKERGNRELIRDLVGFLFPLIVGGGRYHTQSTSTLSNGCICYPNRLLVALQSGAFGNVVSLDVVRRYINNPGERLEIVEGLTLDNCMEFMQRIGDELDFDESLGIWFIEGLCISIARSVDSRVYVEKIRSNRVLGSDPVVVAVDVIVKILDRLRKVDGSYNYLSFSRKVVQDEGSLTFAYWVLLFSLRYENKPYGIGPLHVEFEDLEGLSKIFFDNLMKRCREGRFFDLAKPLDIVRYLYKYHRNGFLEFFEIICSHGEDLDYVAEILFVQCVQVGGRMIVSSFYIEEENLIPYDRLMEVAKQRLSDSELSPRAKAVWSCISTGNAQSVAIKSWS